MSIGLNFRMLVIQEFLESNSHKPTSRYKSGFDECIGDNAFVHDPQETRGPDPLAGSDLNVFAHT
jgi:hypothetical protein